MENNKEADNKNLLQGNFGVENQNREQTPAVGDSIPLDKEITIKRSNGNIIIKETMFNKHINNNIHIARKNEDTNNKQQELGKILPFKKTSSKELSKV